MNNLFTPIKIRSSNIKNRIVMPPMVCFGYGREDGLVTEKHIQHYEARAKGGVGLIIIEATCVDRNGRLSPDQLGLWEDNQIEGFKKIVAICHQYGAKVLIQIHHAGLATVKSTSKDLVAPSDYQGQMRDEFVSARGLSQDEIRIIQNEFVTAAIRAQKAGADGIEFHGAHGFLIGQFLTPLVNKRTDAYGGNLKKRTRFITEMITGIRKATGNDFIIDCRMGCNEPDLQSSIQIAQELEKAGVDILHVSAGFGPPQDNVLQVPQGFNYSWIVYGGTEIKKNVRVPVIVVNGIRTPLQASYLVEKGLADFTAIGTGLQVDPDWANKAKNNQPIIPCLDCQPCQMNEPGGECVQVAKRKNLL